MALLFHHPHIPFSMIHTQLAVCSFRQSQATTYLQMGTPTAVCFHGIQKVGVLEMGQRAVSMGFFGHEFPMGFKH